MPPHSMKTCFGVLIAVLLLACALAPARAGMVWTLDGKTYDGEVKLDPAVGLVVTPKLGGPVKVPLQNVLFATIAAPKSQAPATTNPGNLPESFRGRDIGTVTKPGSVNFFQGTFTLQGAGTDANRTSDSLYFVNQTFHGEGMMAARVVELQPAQKNLPAKAGLMFRATSDPTAIYASLTVSTTGDIEFRCRPADRAETILAGYRTAKLPVWLRLTRTRDGKDFVAEYSENGRKWDIISRTGLAAAGKPEKPIPARLATRLATRAATREAPKVVAAPSIPIGFSSYAGLVVIGGNGPTLSTATFDSFTVRESKGAGFANDRVAPISFVSTPIELVGRGILLKSGTFLADAQLGEFDGSRFKFTYGENKLSASLSQLSRVTIEPLTAGQAGRIPADRMGVLTRNGDFMEGEISSLDREQVKLSSVVFGIASFRVNNGETSAIAFRETDPAQAAYRILMVDGSVLLADTISAERDRIVLNERTLGRMTIPTRDVFVLHAAADSASALTSHKPAKVEGPESFDPAAISLFDKTQSAWLQLPGGASPSGIVSPAGGEITYDVGGKYKRLVCRIGIPERVPARAVAYFVVLAEGKEVFRSKQISSKDPATTIQVPLAQARTVTLKLEGDPKIELSAFGLWGDPMLVK